MRKDLVLIFLFFLLLFFFFYFFVSFDIDAKYMRAAFESGDQSIEGFRFPLLWFVTIPFYWLLKDLVFLVLPLLLFFSSIAFLVKIIELVGLKAKWVIPLALPNFVLFMFIIYYTRDSLNFFLASAFAYYFFQAYYFKKSVLPSGILLALMFFANPQALAFVLFYFLLIFSHKENLVVFIPLKELRQTYGLAIEKLTQFKLGSLFYFYLPFHNYFFVLALICLLFNRQALFALILIMAIFVAGMSIWVTNDLYPDPNPEQLAARYGLEFVPLLLFFVAQTIKQKLGVK